MILQDALQSGGLLRRPIDFAYTIAKVFCALVYGCVGATGLPNGMNPLLGTETKLCLNHGRYIAQPSVSLSHISQ
eukprot:4401725-Amphidinium_carterae.1